MLVKPNTAFTGVPSGRVIGGSAWKARKMKPDPSIRTRWAEALAGAPCAGSTWMSVSGAVARSRVQDVEARAIGAHHPVMLDVQEHARVPQGTAAVAGHVRIVHMDRLRGTRLGGTIRHRIPLG